MPANDPRPKARPKEPSLYDAVIDEFLAWFEDNHDEWHRRMDKLHKDLDEEGVGLAKFDPPGKRIDAAGA